MTFGLLQFVYGQKNLGDTGLPPGRLPEKQKAGSGPYREGDVTTEDFRVALRRYRTFFDRLLSL
jgi:hypothetical protein